MSKYILLLFFVAFLALTYPTARGLALRDSRQVLQQPFSINSKSPFGATESLHQINRDNEKLRPQLFEFKNKNSFILNDEVNQQEASFLQDGELELYKHKEMKAIKSLMIWLSGNVVMETPELMDRALKIYFKLQELAKADDQAKKYLDVLHSLNEITAKGLKESNDEQIKTALAYLSSVHYLVKQKENAIPAIKKILGCSQEMAEYILEKVKRDGLGVEPEKLMNMSLFTATKIKNGKGRKAGYMKDYLKGLQDIVLEEIKNGIPAIKTILSCSQDEAEWVLIEVRKGPRTDYLQTLRWTTAQRAEYIKKEWVRIGPQPNKTYLQKFKNKGREFASFFKKNRIPEWVPLRDYLQNLLNGLRQSKEMGVDSKAAEAQLSASTIKDYLPDVLRRHKEDEAEKVLLQQAKEMRSASVAAEMQAQRDKEMGSHSAAAEVQAQ